MPNNDDVSDIGYYTKGSLPYEHTYGNWTVQWWRWFLSIPKPINPAFDKSGKFAAISQPLEHVWFLAGKVGDAYRTNPKRDCQIPNSRSILFPVISCEVNPLEFPELKTDRDLIERVDADENTITIRECIVDGKRIPSERVKSDPSIFLVEIEEANAFGVENGGITTAASDGYWVFLKPLPVGMHSITFHGSCEYGTLHSGAEYSVQII